MNHTQSWSLYPSLFPLMRAVPCIMDIADTYSFQATDNEWRKMALMNLADCSKELDVDEFWHNALVMKVMGRKQVFKHLAPFVLDALVFPHGCVFSKVNQTMGQAYYWHFQWTHAYTRVCGNRRWLHKIHVNKDNAVFSNCIQSLPENIHHSHSWAI